MRKPTQAFLYSSFLKTLCLFLGIIYSSYSQCPTVTNPIQTFCDLDAPLVSNLSAVNNGNGIRWYATATSTTPLANGQGLINGEDYYADDNSGTCGTRQRVDVTIYGPPMALSFQGVCVDDPNDATIADLIATGNDIQWYTSSSGGTPLATSTVLIDNTIYYVNQSNPDTGCRTSRLSVFVNVGVVPVPMGDPIQEFCTDSQTPTVADLQATGNNNWYLTISSASPLDPSTPLIDGQSYFATTVDPPCESIERLEVLVVFVSPPNPGSNGAIDLCETELTTIGTVNLFDALGGTPDATGTWTGPLPTSNGNLGTVNVTNLIVTGSPYVFTYSVDSGACGSSTSTVSITIVPSPNAGTDNSLTLCESDTPVDLFDSLGGTPEPGGTWMPSLASGTGIFDPAVDAPGDYTYTVSGVSPCSEATAQITVTIEPTPEPGSNGSISLCETELSTIGSVNLFDALGGTPDTTGTWTGPLPTSNGNLGTVNVTTLTVAGSPYIFAYTVDSGSCGSSTSTVTITIVPPPNAGTDNSLTLCENDAPVDLFDSLVGTPEAGGTWMPSLASGTGIFDPVVDAPGVYTYTVNGVSPCSEATAQITVSIEPTPEPGSNGSISLCETELSTIGSVNLFDALGGNPDATGTWTGPLPTSNGNLGTLNVTTLTVTDSPYVFTFTVDSSICASSTSTVTITIVPPLNAGTDNSLTLCESDAPVNLFDNLGGTPEPGGNWTPSLASGTGIFDPSVDSPGTYTYTVSGNSPCGDATAEVTVTIEFIPEPGSNGTLTICEDDTTLYNLFDSLGGAPDTGGVWQPSLASGTGIFNPAVDSPGVYSYAVGMNSPCGSSTSTVTVIFNPIADAGSNANLTLCSNDTPIDLFNSLGGTPTLGGTWSPLLASGTGIFDPSLDGPGAYTYELSGASFCGSDTSTVTVIITDAPNISGLTLTVESVCIGAASLVSISGATQLENGLYTITYALSGSNTSTTTIVIVIGNGAADFNIPASLLTNAGVTTLTLTGLTNDASTCSASLGDVSPVQFNVIQDPTPQLITNGNQFCSEDNPTIAELSANILGTDPVIWYDALEDGTPYPDTVPLVDGTTYYASYDLPEDCDNGIRLTVTVSNTMCEELELIIPDGFSPNDDGINDDFHIKNLRELYPNFYLQIYNRFGNILYEGDINTPNWEGTSDKGREFGSGILPVGVYFYILELKESTNRTIQGRVYLSR